MKTKSRILFSFAALIVASAVWPIRGQGILSQHLGATDPVNEGFTLDIGPGGTVGPVIGDQGRDSWSVVSGGTPTEYFQFLTPQQQTNVAGADWLLSATLRLIETPNVKVSFYTDSQEFSLAFDLQPNGDPIVTTHSSLNPVFVLNGGGFGYHDYSLAYHASTGQASLFVDGLERVSDITGTPHFRSWYVFWGALAQGADSQANWNHVSLEVVPEPSSLALVGLGVSFLTAHLLHRRFRRNV